MAERVIEKSKEGVKEELLQEYNRNQESLKDLQVVLNTTKNADEKIEIEQGIKKIKERQEELLIQLKDLGVESGFGIDQKP